MTGTITEDYGMSLRSSATEGTLSEQRCPSSDSITEWRSCEQVENGTPSTSPPYWDTDDDDDGRSKTFELYGRFTWKIEKFSTINKRELRSNAFEVGGYKWYILIYPQGCDVCNHLSLFLCVANHDKLLPGWSHFAQFTIAVVNKDPKKSKYSDTLHRFWKKEHDWGWKKFMELSKVYDGFIVADTLVIKAQVQVIREKADRPFRCLDCQYRRELVRVYLSNVEKVCRHFLEERIGKLSKFVEDKVRWSGFRAFWFGMDLNSRWRMSRDRTDAILKAVVKHFFIEKEVTSTLVMDSLYSGLKALEFQSKNMKGRARLVDLEELPSPMILVDKDLFVLADDVILLIERVVSDSLPHQPLPSKDDKCPQNRTKDGSSGDEFNKDSIERDEKRLMELGRRTIEIFVLAHIFSSRIEVSYQEAVALKRQEELIREEEAAGQVEHELKSKRGAAEKEKRAKKKQAKQKRNSRKGKDKVKDVRCNQGQERLQQETPLEERTSDSFSSGQVELIIEKIDAREDVSETGDDVAEVLQPDLDDRDTSPTNWDTDTSEIHLITEASGSDVQNGQTEKRSQSVMDDSSSTCSTDSVPSAFMSGPYKGNILPNNNGAQSSPNRRKNHWSRETNNRISLTHGGQIPPETTSVDGHSHDATGSKASQPELEATGFSFKNEIQHLGKNLARKEEVSSLQKKSTSKDQVDAESQSSSSGLGKKPLSTIQQPKHSSVVTTSTAAITAAITTVEPASSKEAPSSSTSQTEKILVLASGSAPVSSSSQSEAQKQNMPLKINTSHQDNAISRPSSAPLVPAPRPPASIASTVQAVPLLSRSVSAAGRLGTDPSPSAPSYIPQSYRNAIIGKTMRARRSDFIDETTSSGQSVSCSQSPSVCLSSASMLPPQAPVRKDQTSVRPGLTFGCLKPEVVHSHHPRIDDSYHESSSSSQRIGSSLVDNMQKLDIDNNLWKEQYPAEIASRITPYQVQGTVAEEFPHLDIINDLLDDEQNIERAARGPQHGFNRQYSLPSNLFAAEFGSLGGSGRFDHSDQYYEEGFLGGYGTSANPLQGLRDGALQQMDLSSYSNNHSQLDGLMRNHWPYGNTDPSMLRLGDGDANTYPYQFRVYRARGGNRYLYHPANGP
uniref:MATH domain-containing protein n=1 Tax=Musa acuminata subsp. malaccensis TaxID=214687 RepID=A0A804I2S2_MUSAM|nr:PREDICTED: MATH domain-containing protein At5g43560 isoform X1 [Musa acuminata subsp. malaccensis]XP_018677979.1 PREDICTED: MATH domain-containing protein At5g43560 isoform X1 [Musa acuminata subsp. malaccensis]